MTNATLHPNSEEKLSVLITVFSVFHFSVFMKHALIFESVLSGFSSDPVPLKNETRSSKTAANKEI